VRSGGHVAGCGHGCENFQIGLDCFPLLRVLFGDDGGAGIGVVALEIVLELSWDGRLWVLSDGGQQALVGLVREWITAGLHNLTGIEVAVGDVGVDAIEIGQNESHGSDGSANTVNVEFFGVGGWAFDREHRKRAEFGKYEDETGIQVTAGAGRLGVLLPPVLLGAAKKFSSEPIEFVARRILREPLLMQDCFRFRNVRQEMANTFPIDLESGGLVTDDVAQIKAINLIESLAEQRAGDFKADVIQITRGCETTLAELIDVEGELGADVGMRRLRVVDDGTIFFL